MKQILIFTLLGIITTSPTFDEKQFSVTNVPQAESSITDTWQRISHFKKKSGYEKLPLKQRLLQKWLKKKLHKNSVNPTNVTGFASFVFAVITILSLLIMIILDLEALLPLLFVSIVTGFLALVLGIISLIIRSGLKNKASTKSWPAISSVLSIILLAIILLIIIL